jgi:hypothetical protein
MEIYGFKGMQGDFLERRQGEERRGLQQVSPTNDENQEIIYIGACQTVVVGDADSQGDHGRVTGGYNTLRFHNADCK